MNCINLKTTYGKRFRVVMDPFVDPRTKDAWSLRLEGRLGYIYPHSLVHMGICINEHPKLCARLVREPWVESYQYGDDGINAIFHKKDLQKAKKYVRLLYKKERKPLTQEQKATLVERLSKARTNPRG